MTFICQPALVSPTSGDNVQRFSAAGAQRIAKEEKEQDRKCKWFNARGNKW